MYDPPDEHRHHGAFPRGPLLGAGALVLFALLAVLGARLAGADPAAVAGEALVVRELRFADRDDGAVAVFDGRSERAVAVLAPGSNGFLRATLRGLARERKRQGADPAVPFRLTGWADGRLTLEDPTTGRRIGLEAFGATNAAAFARLLQVAEARR